MFLEFLANPWVITIIGGIIVIFIGEKIIRKGKAKKFSDNSKQIIQSNNVIVNTHSINSKQENTFNDKVKLSTRILFVDDDNGFKKMVKILCKAGWENVKLINDIKNTDIEDVKSADILFIDIHNVGTSLSPHDEGLGLAILLKQKYPEKKVIMYSADPQGDRSHPALQKIDGFLAKNAEPLQFISLIESFTKEKAK